MTLKDLRRECAQKRWEYQHARQLHSAVVQLEIPDRNALEIELRSAMIAYYGAHGALHARLHASKTQSKDRLH
jgi:hypothetical protein